MPRSALYAGIAAVAAAGSLVTAMARPDSSGDSATLVGASLFVTKGCATCHVGPERAESTSVGPPLSDAPSWAGGRIARMSAEEYLEQSMRSPSAFISPEHDAGSQIQMPLLQLSDEEIDALVDYLLARLPDAIE